MIVWPARPWSLFFTFPFQNHPFTHFTISFFVLFRGCVTSAESVLVSLQSHEEVYRALADKPGLTAFLSISPQSLTSLAAVNSLDPIECLARLRAFFQSKFNFAAVSDTTFARHLSLRETRREYHRSSRAQAASSTSAHPILASACPGWVCYAEKTQPQLLSYMSKAKSPQAIQGMLVKDIWAKSNGRALSRDSIYHVAVMPCFDKKLEASRPDFETDGVRDVDCVVSTGEVQKMLEEAEWDLQTHTATSDPTEEPLWPDFVQHPGTTSGSYMHNVVASLINSAPPSDLPHMRLEHKNIRGGDYSEYTLMQGQQPVFKGAICNGFRNLQNVVRKITPGTGGTSTKRAVVRKRRGAADGAQQQSPANARPYDYIEVMACPSGCINGGGQMPPPKSGTAAAQSIELKDDEGLPIVRPSNMLPAKEWVAQVEQLYWSMQRPADLAAEAPSLDTLDPSIVPFLEPHTETGLEALSRSMEAQIGIEPEGKLQTEFRAVDAPEVNGLAVKW